MKGPPPVYRWTAWKVALKIRHYQILGRYKDLKERENECKWIRTIEKDLDRTFPLHPLFGDTMFATKGRNALRSILIAYSVYLPRVGYCQGMNFVAGFFLIIS